MTGSEDDHGRRIRSLEEDLGGFWVDHPENTFEPAAAGTTITLAVATTS